MVVLPLADDVEHLELELLAGFGDVLGPGGVAGPLLRRREGLMEPLPLFLCHLRRELLGDRRLRLPQGELEELADVRAHVEEEADESQPHEPQQPEAAEDQRLGTAARRRTGLWIERGHGGWSGLDARGFHEVSRGRVDLQGLFYHDPARAAI